MTEEAYREHILSVPLFAGLTRQTRGVIADRLMEIGLVKRLSAGQALYEKGAEDLNTGAVLLEGAVTVDPGNGKPIGLSGPELVGELQQYDDHGRRSATVKSSEDCAFLEFSWHDLIKGLLDSPHFDAAMQEELRAAMDRLAAQRIKQLSDLLRRE